MKAKLIIENITEDYGRNLLKSRGIEDVDRFLNPTEDCLQDWRDLDNIERGVNCILHLPTSGNIAIVVDCDVDGFTSAAIIGQYLQRFYPKMFIKYYIHKLFII